MRSGGALHTLRVLSAASRVALMSLMQYRSSFLLQIGVGLTSVLGVVLPMVLVWQATPVIGGFTLREALLISSFFLLLGGTMGALVEPNLAATVDAVRTGSFDHVLLKPVDAQLLCSLRQVDPSRLWEVVAGLSLGAWALAGLATPSLAQAGAALLLFGAGLAAMYGLWIVAISLCFWFVRVDHLRFLLVAVTDTGRWPVTVYRGWARTLVTVVVPVALVTSYPAMALLGRLEPEMAAGAGVVGAASLVLSRLVWRSALRHYSSTS